MYIHRDLSGSFLVGNVSLFLSLGKYSHLVVKEPHRKVLKKTVRIIVQYCHLKFPLCLRMSERVQRSGDGGGYLSGTRLEIYSVCYRLHLKI